MNKKHLKITSLKYHNNTTWFSYTFKKFTMNQLLENFMNECDDVDLSATVLWRHWRHNWWRWFFYAQMKIVCRSSWKPIQHKSSERWPKLNPNNVQPWISQLLMFFILWLTDPVFLWIPSFHMPMEYTK